MIDSGPTFLDTMIAIAVVAVLAFLAYLLSGVLNRAGGEAARDGGSAGPRWYEVTLAMILLVAVTALLAWQVFGSGFDPGDDWRGGARAVTFFIVMLVAGVLGILAFLVLLIARHRAARGSRPSAPAAGPATEDTAEAVQTPSAVRLLGLLVLVFALLLIGWIYLPATGQRTLMTNLLYPASLAVTLVMLFDKASRTWQVKSTMESIREWLLCDAIVVVLVLAYFNVLNNAPADAYAAFFWDMVFIGLTITVLWVLDRKAASARFLLFQGYMILVPVGLLIWRAQQGIEAPETLSWWSTIWPFFGLAVIFFVIEAVVQMIAAARQRHLPLLIKDLVFVVIYAVLLIGAIPDAAG